MRVLIVHHGRLPEPGQPCSGGAIRAALLGQGLREGGHEVHFLARDQDEPGGFSSPVDLVLKARARAPDALLAVQLEDAPALAALERPLVVDLYAPRLLEAPFEGRMGEVAPAVLRALGAGDGFLVSNPRQRWGWLSALALAGFELEPDPTLLVPIASLPMQAQPPPASPVLVAGGGAWPWCDPEPDLRRILALLDARGLGEIHWFGPGELPAHPRLHRRGTVAWDALRRAFAAATAAIDFHRPNPEREQALGFRHADYLAAGLPILCRPGTAVAELLEGAAWPGEPEVSVGALLDDLATGGAQRQRRARAALRLARSRDPRSTVEPLLAWLSSPTRARRGSSRLLDAAGLAERAARAEAEATHLREHAARAEAEALEKRREVAEWTARHQQLSGVVERQARALDEVAGFKREAIALLGGRNEASARELSEAQARIALLAADLEKKNAELRAAMEQREALESEALRARAAQQELELLRGELARRLIELEALSSLRQRVAELRRLRPWRFGS